MGLFIAFNSSISYVYLSSIYALLNHSSVIKLCPYSVDYISTGIVNLLAIYYQQLIKYWVD